MEDNSQTELINTTIQIEDEEPIEDTLLHTFDQVMDAIHSNSSDRMRIFINIDSNNKEAIISELEYYGLEVMRRPNHSIVVRW